MGANSSRVAAPLTLSEGDWTPSRLALLKFDSAEQAKAWLNSPEYTALNELRTSSSNINMVIVEGL